MTDFFHIVALTYVSLFPICNPFGNAAIFLSITSGEKKDNRARLALKGSLYMFAILITFFFSGSWIMHFFGISIDAIRIAGGVVIARVGMHLLSANQSHVHTPEEHDAAVEKEDISLTPLAIPILAGPGAMAVVMGLATNVREPSILSYAGFSTGIFLIALSCYLCLKESEWIQKVLGVNGINAITRIMGFLLLCIAVQLMAQGLDGLVNSWMSKMR